MKPLVSVFIPSFNHEKYIIQSLTSLYLQTYKNIQVIIIDDGSVDQSAEIIEGFLPKLREITSDVIFVLQENAGICKTFNRGLQYAKGEYFCILPSDDLMHESFLEQQVDYLERNLNYGCSYTNGLHINTIFIEANEFDKGTAFSEKINFKSGNINKHLLSNVFRLPSPSFVYRTNLIREIGGLDEEVQFEDVDLMLRFSKRYEIGFIDEYLFFHRIHGYNSGRNKDIIFNALEVLTRKYIINNYLKLDNNELAELANHFNQVREELTSRKKFLFDIDVDIVKRLAGGRKIVAWGTGAFAESFFLQFPEFKVDYFIDSNKEGTWKGYRVKKPQQLQQDSNYFVLILSSFDKEIGMQLEGMGLKRDLDFQ